MASELVILRISSMAFDYNDVDFWIPLAQSRATRIFSGLSCSRCWDIYRPVFGVGRRVLRSMMVQGQSDNCGVTSIQLFSHISHLHCESQLVHIPYCREITAGLSPILHGKVDLFYTNPDTYQSTQSYFLEMYMGHYRKKVGIIRAHSISMQFFHPLPWLYGHSPALLVCLSVPLSVCLCLPVCMSMPPCLPVNSKAVQPIFT